MVKACGASVAKLVLFVVNALFWVRHVMSCYVMFDASPVQIEAKYFTGHWHCM